MPFVPTSLRAKRGEVPKYESNRGPGSTADVDFWTARNIRETLRSHVNYIVADTRQWEQSTAFRIDTHPVVNAWVKNAGLGFAIPYLHNGQRHDYLPDFIIRLNTEPASHLILETKGFDPLEEVKSAAAARWVAAVNADGTFGPWSYALAKKVADVADLIIVATKTCLPVASS